MDPDFKRDNTQTWRQLRGGRFLRCLKTLREPTTTPDIILFTITFSAIRYLSKFFQQASFRCEGPQRATPFFEWSQAESSPLTHAMQFVSNILQARDPSGFRRFLFTYTLEASTRLAEQSKPFHHLRWSRYCSKFRRACLLVHSSLYRRHRERLQEWPTKIGQSLDIRVPRLQKTKNKNKK